MVSWSIDDDDSCDFLHFNIFSDVPFLSVKIFKANIFSITYQHIRCWCRGVAVFLGSLYTQGFGVVNRGQPASQQTFREYPFCVYLVELTTRLFVSDRHTRIVCKHEGRFGQDDET